MFKEDELKSRFTVLIILCVAIIVSLFIYAYVVDFIDEQNAPFHGFVPEFGDVQTLRYALLGATLAIFLIIRPLKRFLLSEKLSAMLGHTAGSSTVPYSQYTSAYVLVYALCESVGIFGLVMFLIAGNKVDFYTFMPLSLVAMGYNFPKYANMKSWAMKMSGVPENAYASGRGSKDYRKG